MDVFFTNDSLFEFLGAYDNLPHYQHSHGFSYILNVEAYFGKDVELAKSDDEIAKEFPQLKDIPQKSNLIISDTIDIKMDPCNDDKIIKTRKCLTNEEQKEYSKLLHEFPKIFS